MFEYGADYRTDNYLSKTEIDKACVLDKYGQNTDDSAFRVQFVDCDIMQEVKKYDLLNIEEKENENDCVVNTGDNDESIFDVD